MTQNPAQITAQKRDFNDEPLKTTVIEWFQDLEEDPGGRAALRRAGRPYEVALVPAFHRLRDATRDAIPSTSWANQRLEIIAGVLAHAKAHGGTRPFAAQLSQRVGDRPMISDLRFRRLLQLTEPEALMATYRRVLHLLDGLVNVPDVARTLFLWNDRFRGDEVRKALAYEYYRRLEK